MEECTTSQVKQSWTIEDGYSKEEKRGEAKENVVKLNRDTHQTKEEIPRLMGMIRKYMKRGNVDTKVRKLFIGAIFDLYDQIVIRR